MAVSTYRIWEREDIAISPKKEKDPAERDQFIKIFEKIKKFNGPQWPQAALWSYPGDGSEAREHRWDD